MSDKDVSNSKLASSPYVLMPILWHSMSDFNLHDLWYFYVFQEVAWGAI